MLDAQTLIKATVQAGRAALQPPPAPAVVDNNPLTQWAEQVVASSNKPRHHLLPMRSLGPAHVPRIEAHLLRLNERDRYLRFGFAATDEQIARYVAHLNFDRDEIYGVYNRKLELTAVAHLAFAAEASCNSCAEFGVSVLASARGRGYGSRLFERALIHARNEGVQMLFIHALSSNAPMLAIARKHGATLERHGSETEAFLKLAPPDWESRLDEFLEDKVADIDFELKLQAKQFWGFLAAVKHIREALPRGE